MYPPYSPYLAPADYHLSGAMKEGLRSKHHAIDKEMKTTEMKWLKEQSTEFWKAGTHAFLWRWNIAIKRNGDYVEK